jgi:hypothetical protein
MTVNCHTVKKHQGVLNTTRQAESPVISVYAKGGKLVVGRENIIILQVRVNCVLHIRSEEKLETFVISALFRFTKGVVF